MTNKAKTVSSNITVKSGVTPLMDRAAYALFETTLFHYIPSHTSCVGDLCSFGNKILLLNLSICQANFYYAIEKYVTKKLLKTLFMIALVFKEFFYELFHHKIEVIECFHYVLPIRSLPIKQNAP